MTSESSSPAGPIAQVCLPNRVDAFIGGRIAALRTEQILSRRSLAERVKSDADTLAQYEQGVLSVPANVLYALSKALNVSLHDFLVIDSKRAAE